MEEQTEKKSDEQKSQDPSNEPLKENASESSLKQTPSQESSNMFYSSIALWLLGIIAILFSYHIAAFVMMIGAVFYGDCYILSVKQYSAKKMLLSLFLIILLFLGLVL